MNRRLISGARIKPCAIVFAAMLAIAVLSPPVAHATAEGVLVGAFDKVTGVPVMGALLELVRSGESSPRSPEALDQRLREVEGLLKDMERRLSLVETRVLQLQNEAVKVANINRLRELQGLRAAIELINQEMLLYPADPDQRTILVFRAQQQADLIKNNVAFDTWKWSRVDPASELVETQFHVMPSFELYALALTTWFTTIDIKFAEQPQRVIADHGAALREHAAFLRLRDGWRVFDAEPQTLLEHLYTAAYCRLGALDTYSKPSGDCRFAEECVDKMEDTTTETGRITRSVQPPVAGILCTWNPDRDHFITGEEELRAAYGAEVMTSFASALERLATTGSLRDQFIGEFDTRIPRQTRALYALNIDEPLVAPAGAVIDVQLAFKSCHGIARVSAACELVPAYQQWSYDRATHQLLHVESGKCINISGARHDAGSPIILYPCSGAPNEKWTVTVRPGTAIWTVKSDLTSHCLHALPGRSGGGDGTQVWLSTPSKLVQMPCDGSEAQRFNDVDANWSRRNPGPR